MLHDIEVHGEEAGLQGGAEGVALHQADLSVGRLVAEQVLLRGNHVLQHLKNKGHPKKTIREISECISDPTHSLTVAHFVLKIISQLFLYLAQHLHVVLEKL